MTPLPITVYVHQRLRRHTRKERKVAENLIARHMGRDMARKLVGGPYRLEIGHQINGGPVEWVDTLQTIANVLKKEPMKNPFEAPEKDPAPVFTCKPCGKKHSSTEKWESGVWKVPATITTSNSADGYYFHCLECGKKKEPEVEEMTF